MTEEIGGMTGERGLDLLTTVLKQDEMKYS